jgi:hypothetical protein
MGTRKSTAALDRFAKDWFSISNADRATRLAVENEMGLPIELGGPFTFQKRRRLRAQLYGAGAVGYFGRGGIGL